MANMDCRQHVQRSKICTTADPTTGENLKPRAPSDLAKHHFSTLVNLDRWQRAFDQLSVCSCTSTKQFREHFDANTNGDSELQQHH